MDPLIYRTINQLQEVVKQKKRLEQDSSHTQESLELALDNLTLDGVTIEDLCLEFVLPGFPNIELKVRLYSNNNSDNNNKYFISPFLSYRYFDKRES